MRGVASHFLPPFLALEDMGVWLLYARFFVSVCKVDDGRKRGIVWMTWLIKKQTAY